MGFMRANWGVERRWWVESCGVGGFSWWFEGGGLNGIRAERGVREGGRWIGGGEWG